MKKTTKILCAIGIPLILSGILILAISPDSSMTSIPNPFNRYEPDVGWMGNYWEAHWNSSEGVSGMGGNFFINRLWYSLYGVQGLDGYVNLSLSSTPIAGSCNVSVAFCRPALVGCTNTTIRFGNDGVPIGDVGFDVPNILDYEIISVIIEDTFHNTVDVTVRIYIYGSGGTSGIPVGIIICGAILLAAAVLDVVGVFNRWKKQRPASCSSVPAPGVSSNLSRFDGIMVCHRCGAEIKIHQKFCDKCGAKQ